MLSKARLIFVTLIILLLITGCYAPSQEEGTRMSTVYRNCVDAENWFCGEECQARCRALAVEVCR